MTSQLDEQAFGEYIAAFNARDYDRMVAFYADDVVLDLPKASPRGPAAIKAYYQELHTSLRERLEVRWLLIGPDKLAFECYTEFHCLQDRPQFSMGPLTRGQTLRCTNFVNYDLRDDKFADIRVARYKIWGIDNADPA